MLQEERRRRCDALADDEGWPVPHREARAMCNPLHLVRRATALQVAIAVLGHPLRPREMARPRSLCPSRILHHVQFQHYSGCFPPIGTSRVGVEQPQIRDKMGHVVAGQKRPGRSGVSDGWLRHRGKVGRSSCRRIVPSHATRDAAGATLFDSAGAFRTRLWPGRRNRPTAAQANDHSTPFGCD